MILSFGSCSDHEKLDVSCLHDVFREDFGALTLGRDISVYIAFEICDVNPKLLI